MVWDGKGGVRIRVVRMVKVAAYGEVRSRVAHQ
jgi:hypothetical protein